MLRFMQHDYVEYVIQVISIVNSCKMCLCNDTTTPLSPRHRACQLKWLVVLLSTIGSAARLLLQQVLRKLYVPVA